MARRVALIVALALACAEGAAADIRLVQPFPLERYAARGAVGLYVPGTGATVSGTALELEILGRAGVTRLPLPPGSHALLRLRIGAAGAPVVYMTLPPAGETANDRRYPIAVVGAGFHGVLTSDSTRLDGLVTLDDVLERRLEWRRDGNAVATVERLDRRIERNDDVRRPATILVVTAAIALALVRPRLAPRAILLALALNLWLSPALAAAAALAALALPLGTACAAVLAVYLAALGLDAETVALSPLGPSQVGRFYGINNLTETFLLLPALLGAALVGRLGVLVGALALVTIAGSRFGADGGGLLVLLTGLAVLWLRLRGRRLTWRLAAGVAAAVVAAGLVLAGIDAATGGSSHVSRALGGGPGSLADELGDRLGHSLDRTFSAPGPAIVSIVFLGVLAWVAVRRRGEPVIDAVLAALAVSLVVNDTPSDVLAAGSAVAFAVLHARRLALPHRRAPG